MRARSRVHFLDRLSSAGFTLVEMLVTLLIFSVVAVTLTLVIMSSARSKQRTSQRIESEQGARAALDLMSRDIRTAGYGADRAAAVPQPAIAYVDSQQIILGENQLPYPDNAVGAPNAPLAYNPNGVPKPFPLNGTPFAPPIRYNTGAELIRFTLDVNNDGVVDASDVAAPEGADAAATPNPNDYTLVRQVYGDMTAGLAGNNGGTTQRVALVRKPANAGVPPLFNVYMRGQSTAWDWSNGPVPSAQLNNIQRIELQVTATASRPDSRGQYAQTTLKNEVNAARSVPDFGAPTYSVSGYVFNDLNTDHLKNGSDVGLAGSTVRMGNLVSYTNGAGLFTFQAPAGNYVLKHTPPMGYGSYTVPDSFNIALSNVALTRDFPDTARAGGNVNIFAFNDANGNGTQDGSEGPMEGIKFTIVPGTPEAPNGTTDTYGTLTLFTGVGNYQITCNKPDTLMVTSPSNPYDSSSPMTNSGSASVRFGLCNQVVEHVRGKVYTDANRNGVLDGGEAGISAVWVGVSKDAGLNVAGYAYTDGNGDYDVTASVNDPPHTQPYSVYVVPPAGR